MDVVQFVDSISATPTVRLDLNSEAPWALNYDGTDFSPPPLRQAWASTLLADGEKLTASAYDNRVIKLRLDLQTASLDAAWTQMQLLYRELNRPSNFLKWQPDGTTSPVFFRTLRSVRNQVTEYPGPGKLRTLDVEIVAEPFAYGLKEALPSVTVYNDPQEGTALNANPYFESTASPWTAIGGTVAQSTAQFHEGAASLLLTPDGVTATVEARSENASGVVAGQTYRASAWVRCPVARSVNANIVWRDAGGVFLSSAGAVSVSAAADTWTYIEVSGVAPASAAQGQISVSMGSTPPASNLLYIDEARIRQAGGSGGMRLDVTGVKGDVETPIKVTIPYSGTSSTWIFAVRRRGTPSLAPFVLQCEAMTQGTDTTTQPNDAAMSGSGNNYSRTTFATNAGMAQRLSTSWPPPGVDVRGRYRVFAVARRSNGVGVINAKLGWGTKGSSPSAYGSPASPDQTNAAFLDLGLVSYPGGADPVTDGYSGVALSVLDQNVSVWAERVSGTSTIDWDYLLFVPADDRIALITRPIGISDYVSTVNGEKFVVDGTAEALYALYGTGDIYGGWAGTVTSGKVVGGFPLVSPGVTNRLYMVQTGVPVSPTKTAQVTIEYWPRYLYARPPSS